MHIKLTSPPLIHNVLYQEILCHHWHLYKLQNISDLMLRSMVYQAVLFKKLVLKLVSINVLITGMFCYKGVIQCYICPKRTFGRNFPKEIYVNIDVNTVDIRKRSISRKHLLFRIQTTTAKFILTSEYSSIIQIQVTFLYSYLRLHGLGLVWF